MKPWTKAQKATVLAIYGMAIGSILVWTGTQQILPHLLENGMERDELWLLVGFVVGGVAIAIPTAVMQLIGKALELGQHLVALYRGFRGWDPPKRED